MMPIFRLTKIVIAFSLLIISCSPSSTITPTVVDVESNVITMPTETKEATFTPNPTESNLPENTALPMPTDVISFIGTAVPENSEVISKNNFINIKKVGQWGRGSILGVSFTPDGKSFVAVSEMGWSIYSMDAINQTPQWISFDEPILFDDFYFSNDGTQVKFIRQDYESTFTQVRTFPAGKTQELDNNTEWLAPNVKTRYTDITLRSPDGEKIFRSNLDYEFNEATFSEEISVRKMYDGNNNFLYDLRDDVPYVSYSDRNGPEGCDLSVFSPCGNALMAVATTPVKALFSPDNATFATLNAPPSLYFGIMRAFSYIRIYDSATGDFIGSVGGFTKPVQDFAYSPDGKLLVVGYVDGSIVLWDIKNSNVIFGARHMNAPTWKVEYSYDSKFILIQRAGEVEVRLTKNGSLLSRYGAGEFAVSPTKNLIVLGDEEGIIRVQNIETGDEVLKIEGHEDSIYALAFSPDGLYLASSGKDCDIKLWDLQTGKLLHYFEETAVDAYEIDFSSRIFSTYLEFIPDKNMLIGFGSWGTVANWNVNSGATNYVIQSDSLEYYNGMVTIKPHFPEFFEINLPEDKYYINENEFNLSTGEKLGIYQLPANLPEGCSPVGPTSIDKNLKFTRGYDKREGKICVLDEQNLNLLGEIFITPSNNSYAVGVDWLYLSPDGKQLIVTVGSGVMYVYQIAE